jgi:ketosteroid isomerase-like protein
MAMTPVQAVIELDEAFARRDLAGVLAFYEDDAVVVAEPNRIIQGKEELRQFFTRMFMLNGRAQQLKTRAIESGDIALFISKWQFSGTGQDGSPFSREFVATCIFRRGIDSRWRLVIDNSLGPMVLESAGA